ncbi:MAG: helix-turn-helix domain-containing protein [Nanoarchaeota archaeon]
MDLSTLREAGLTNGEIKVYTSLLKLGSVTSGPLIKESHISRSIIYEILNKLIEKGLVSYVIKDKTKHYQASDPKAIEGYIEERIKSLNKNKSEIEGILPYLLSLKNSAKGSTVQAYEGFKGIQIAHENLYERLKKGDEYYYLGIFSFQKEEQHSYWQRDHLRRIKAGIKCRLLFNNDTDKSVLKNRNGYKGCEARYMPSDIKTPAWVGGYKDVTFIGLQTDEPIAIEIVNQPIADSFKAYFEEFWKKSKKFK